MKNKLEKHITDKDYVKVYITDEDDIQITHFEGIVFAQTEEIIVMSDSTDFFYDGIVIVRKKDISEIKHTDNERFVKEIMSKEGLIEITEKNWASNNIKPGSFNEILNQLKTSEKAIIVECKYGSDDIFQIGPIKEVTEESVRLNYFNARGEYDLKPTISKMDRITFIKFDSPYANIFHKYAFKID